MLCKSVNYFSPTCADPGIFDRGGGPGQTDKKRSDDVCFCFFGPQLILQKSNGQFQRNLSLFKVPEGVRHFQGGSNFFQGGSNCLFPIETHITCDFPGGGSGPPVPPSGSALAPITGKIGDISLLYSFSTLAFSPSGPGAL